jgi:hypothetical protein
MGLRHSSGAASIALLAIVMSWGCHRAPAQQGTAAGDPARILQRMSDTLAGAKQMTFKMTRQLDPALVAGASTPESEAIEVAISRPRMVRATLVSPHGIRHFYADGQQVTLFDDVMDLYATVPVGGTIDQMVAQIESKFGFDPPVAEFVVNDPLRKLREQMKNSVYMGAGAIDGVACDHLRLVGDTADAELWVGIVDHLPRRLIATYKDRPGNPQLRVDFFDWDLSANLEDSMFAFEPPRGAEPIDMQTGDAIAPDNTDAAQ